MKVTVFSTLAFERPFLERASGGRHELHFKDVALGANTVALAQGSDAVCVFTPDDVSAPVLEQLWDHGVRFVAVRGTGYDNVDMPDGTCQSPQGRTMMLREGQSKMMDGTVTMHPNEHSGHPLPRPKK